jgi:hypothetical protein
MEMADTNGTNGLEPKPKAEAGGKKKGRAFVTSCPTEKG